MLAVRRRASDQIRSSAPCAFELFHGRAVTSIAAMAVPPLVSPRFGGVRARSWVSATASLIAVASRAMLGSLISVTAKLFDDFERTNPRPRGHEESVFSFLNRVDQPFWQRIREELERWYADYPDEQRGFDLRQRFRRPEPAQHFGAWWELYLHRLFRCLGFGVEVEPEVPGGKPDFRVTRDSDSFLMEATTSFSGIVDEERHPKREAAVLAAIDQARNPNFTVGLEIQQVGDEQPSVPEIVGPLEHWLLGLNPDDELERDIFDAPQCLLDVRGWKLLLTAFALRPEARGKPDHRLLGMGPGMSGYVNDREQLVAALIGKRRKYKPEEPFVLAVLMMSSGSVDHEDVEAALLGTVAYPVLPERGLGPPFRQSDGFWRGGDSPRGTRVSAVLTGDNLVAENVARTWPRLWPNPWAARPLTVDLPFPRGVATAQRVVSYEEAAGTSHSILGLPQDWPGPGKPFSKPWTTS